MEALLGDIGAWAWFVVWTILLLVGSLLVYLGLGGNFVILGLALIHALATGFDPLGWVLLLILLALVLLGEGVEFVVGNFWVAKRGAAKRAVAGGFVGGLVGAAAGGTLLPIIGAVPGSFLGAFAGSILGEYHRRRNLEPALRVGWHAFLGRLAAILFKHALSLVMIFLILRETWPVSD